MEDTLRFTVDDMTCGGCVRTITLALEEVPSVAVDHIAVGEPVEVRYDDTQTDREAVLAAVESAGYHPLALAGD